MEIIAKCPECYYPNRFTAEAADRRLRCYRCSHLFKVPRLDELPKANSLIKNLNSGVTVDENGRYYG